MELVKRILRGTGLFLSTWLLWLVLGSGLTLLATTTHLTNRETVKSWPAEAGVYQEIIDLLPELIAEEGGTDDGKSIQEMLDESGLDQDKLFEAIEEVIPPEYLEEQANIALDALYDALEGEKDVLAFTLPLSEKSEELNTAIANELLEQIKEYPACTPVQLTELARGEFDPLEANCIPPGVDVTEEIQFTSEDLSTGEEAILQDIEVTAGDASFINRNIENLQFSFGESQRLPQFLLGTILVFGTLIVLFSKSVLRGVKKLGGILFVQGVGTSILYFLLPRLSVVAADNISTDGDEGGAEQKLIDRIIEPLFNTALSDISSTGLRIGILTAAVGALLWLGVYTWRKIHDEPQDAHAPKKTPDSLTTPAQSLEEPATQKESHAQKQPEPQKQPAADEESTAKKEPPTGTETITKKEKTSSQKDSATDQAPKN